MPLLKMAFFHAVLCETSSLVQIETLNVPARLFPVVHGRPSPPRDNRSKYSAGTSRGFLPPCSTAGRCADSSDHMRRKSFFPRAVGR